MIRKLMPLWGQARTTVLTLAGFAGLTSAAWMVAVPLGLAVGGLSAFALEYLTSPDGGRAR
ncbi:hypothetical protein ACFV1F_16870 [Streptomyces sp. NPDC059590]|uniref:hypothetical protein n=1 Tax=Streptomyces sp. NPDC059590 TaxID=3346877 RepID=UPI003692EC90